MRHRVLYASACAVTVPAYVINFDLLIPKFNVFISVPYYIIGESLVKIRLILFKTVLTSQESGFQCTLFHRDLDLCPQIVKHSSVSHNASLM